MPRLKHQPPKLRRHVRGQAVVRINGKDRYLGPYGTIKARVKYREIVTEWNLQRAAEAREATPPIPEEPSTVAELCLAYQDSPEGKSVSQPHSVASALAVLCELYGSIEPANMGPKKLKAVREKFLTLDWTRGYLNEQISRIKRMFKWAVSEELVTNSVWQALTSIEGLRRGKCEAKEGKKVKPVPQHIVDATLVHLGPIVADMVRVQLLCGGRPQDVCNLRPCDIVQEGEAWLYQPSPEHPQSVSGP